MSEYLRNTLYHPNEIAKTGDFNFGQDRNAENVHAAFRHWFGGVSNNVVIHGLMVTEVGTPSMNVDVSVGALYDPTEGEVLFSGAEKGPIAIDPSDGSQNRIDIVEISLVVTDYYTQQRAFKDPVSGSLTYSDVSTRQRYDISVNVVTGTLGSGTAPASTSGSIKIAEVHVAAGVSAIYDADIRNVSATIDGEANSNWTNETTSVFKIGDHSYVKSILRTAHNEDGTHKADSIKDDDIDFGSGSGQISASNVPIDQTQLHYSGSTQVMAALDDIDQKLYDQVNIDSSTLHYSSTDYLHTAIDDIDQELYDQVNIDSSNLHYSSTNDLHMAIDDIDQTQYDHNTNNITSSNSVHGIQQGSGYGFDADKVDGNDYQDILNKVWPIGSTYTQYPGKNDPGTLGLPGTWDNISSEFSGDFFRAEGGEASTFESGEQSDTFASHNHSGSADSDTHSHNVDDHQHHNQHNHNFDAEGFTEQGSGAYHVGIGSDNTSAFNGGSGDSAWTDDYTGDTGFTDRDVNTDSDSHSHSITVGSTGGSETRPVNRTIRIWERVS